MNIKVEGVYTLLSRLSHIGESSGIDSFLNTTSIVNATSDGVEEMPIINGNAIRGTLRDRMATYMLDNNNADEQEMDSATDALDKDDNKKQKVSLTLFNLLFSGGNISGEQKTDIKKFKEIRETIPMVSILGGGVGSGILTGKINVSDGYLLCLETKHIIPKKYADCCILSWREQTGESSFTRMDDTKDIHKQVFLNEEPSTEKKKGEASTQMRYTIETLDAGAKIYHEILCKDMTEVEMGCLVSGIIKMAEAPFLCGKQNIGMGKYMLEYKVDNKPFISVESNGSINISNEAKNYLKAYDERIKDIDFASIEIS